MKKYKVSWQQVVKLVERITGDDISDMIVEKIEWEVDRDGYPKSLIIKVKEPEIEFIPSDDFGDVEVIDEEELEEEEEL